MKNENDLLALAAELNVAPPAISKVRRARLPVGATLIIKLHEATGMAVADIKAYITHGPQQVAK